MGKFYESTSTFSYPWEHLATAFWRRYPNPHSTHVLTEDILRREIRGDQLFTKRILTKTNRLPKWGERFVPTTIVAIVEESYVDIKSRVLTTYTRNVGLSRIMSVTERVTYTPDPSNPTGQTLATRHAWIESQMYGLRRAIEAFGMERFRSNASKAAAGFNHVLGILYPQFHLLAVGSSGGVTFGDETMKERLRQKAKKVFADKISIASVSTNQQ